MRLRMPITELSMSAPSMKQPSAIRASFTLQSCSLVGARKRGWVKMGLLAS